VNHLSDNIIVKYRLQTFQNRVDDVSRTSSYVFRLLNVSFMKSLIYSDDKIHWFSSNFKWYI